MSYPITWQSLFYSISRFLNICSFSNDSIADNVSPWHLATRCSFRWRYEQSALPSTKSSIVQHTYNLIIQPRRNHRKYPERQNEIEHRQCNGQDVQSIPTDKDTVDELAAQVWNFGKKKNKTQFCANLEGGTQGQSLSRTLTHGNFAIITGTYSDDSGKC